MKGYYNVRTGAGAGGRKLQSTSYYGVENMHRHEKGHYVGEHSKNSLAREKTTYSNSSRPQELQHEHGTSREVKMTSRKEDLEASRLRQPYIAVESKGEELGMHKQG